MSTTPDSVIAALTALEPSQMHLICGGATKGMDYRALAKALRKAPPQSLTLIAGPLQAELARLLGPAHHWQLAQTPAEAVALASRHAAKGESVLLSPGGAYYIYYGPSVGMEACKPKNLIDQLS
jgi:UDP-N-acetylmuramoylalanine-D-glutamate ligase